MKFQQIFLALTLSLIIVLLLLYPPTLGPELKKPQHIREPAKDTTASAIKAAKTTLTNNHFYFYKGKIKCSNRTIFTRSSREMRGDNWILFNYIRADRQFQCFESVTYTTQCDHTFLDNLIPVVTRWQGPVSVAIFAPGKDYEKVMSLITYYRQVQRGNLINLDGPSLIILEFGHAGIVSEHQAKMLAPNCSLKEPKGNDETFRKQNHILYPINVGRNIAIQAASTHWIFPSDIELYPSTGFIPSFLGMIAKNEDPILRGTSGSNRVFVLPTFEVEHGMPVPENKTALLKMLKEETAIQFHSRLCVNCHHIDGIESWMATIKTGNRSDNLGILKVLKRLGKQKTWEPFYVATHNEPLFDERLSWEGRGNKMVMGLKLCLLDYNYMILDNAFLVHKPGIKDKTTNKNRPDWGNYHQQQLDIKNYTSEVTSIYGYRKGCCSNYRACLE